jgi:hypothetical protein
MSQFGDKQHSLTFNGSSMVLGTNFSLILILRIQQANGSILKFWAQHATATLAKD